ncbi:MAG: 30S ribosomal protein S9 [Candidatus Eiseniibacteriota bacterium]
MTKGSTAAPTSTGRRKEATARVRLVPGSGQAFVNGRPIAQYFMRPALVKHAEAPLALTHTIGRYDIYASTHGGGLAGQAGAVRLGIARALVRIDDTLRGPLGKEGLLTRDARMKERKKYGQAGARKRFQFSKR